MVIANHHFGGSTDCPRSRAERRPTCVHHVLANGADTLRVDNGAQVTDIAGGRGIGNTRYPKTR